MLDQRPCLFFTFDDSPEIFKKELVKRDLMLNDKWARVLCRLIENERLKLTENRLFVSVIKLGKKWDYLQNPYT